MTDHKFRVGQLVRLQREDAATGLYQVVHILPTTPDGELHYRLRGIHEPHERMAVERHITRAVQINPGTASGASPA